MCDDHLCHDVIYVKSMNVSIEMHSSFASVMGQFPNCTRNVSVEPKWPCPACERALQGSYGNTGKKRICCQICWRAVKLWKVKIPAFEGGLYWAECSITCKSRHIRGLCTENRRSCMSKNVQKYLRFDMKGHEIDQTGKVFTVNASSRKMYKPLLRFEMNETHRCDKKYPVSQSHSPGLFTVQCACVHPKLIFFVIMTRAESTALALSSVTSFFRVLPDSVL